jgi:high-affinity nickel-transport protein
MTILPALALGLALGVRHATDADHVAAVSTIVTESRSLRRAALVGLSWGIGHSTSVLVVGGALVLLRLPMPTRVALALEFLAALMLIALGVRSLITRTRTPAAANNVRPAAIGVVHGLAGSAVLALLVLGATNSPSAAAVYLVSFCVGTVLGMSLITALLALPAQYGAQRVAAFDRHIRIAAGVASLAIGLLIAHRVGVRDGLFAATPTWTPE